MVKLDTSSKPYRLDAGVKIPIAVDLISGDTYEKIAASMPFGRRPLKELKAEHPAMQLADLHGANLEDLHQEHCDDEWFRGVWVKLGDATDAEVESEPVDENVIEHPDATKTAKKKIAKRR